MNEVKDIWVVLAHSLNEALSSVVNFIPHLISALIILFIGWIIARIVKTILIKLLKALKFNSIADKVGINPTLAKAGLKSDAAGWMGKLAYWIIMFTTLTLFFSKLGLPEVSGLLQQVVAYIPKLIVGCMLLIIGMYAADFLRDLVTATLKGGGFESPNLVGNITYGGVMFLVVSIVLNTIGVGTEIVNTLVTSVLGGISIATAIAFGLGGREWAAKQIKNISKMD